jgi:hypothetical protein
MKKLLLISLLIGAAVSATSCKKEYTCSCQKIYTGSSGSTSIDDGVYTYKDSRTRAEDRCDDEETTGSDLGGDYSRECQID